MEASTSIHASCSWARPGPVAFSMPRTGGMNGPQLAVGVLGESHTRLFRGSIPGNGPTGSEAFPALFCDDVTRASRRGVATRADQRRNS